MDYERINACMDEFLNETSNGVYIDVFEGIKNLCRDILHKNPLPINNSNYSRTFSINESINIIVIFLDTLDPMLTEQFLNIINRVDENGEPTVRFINANKDYYDKHPEELTDALKEELKTDSRVSNGHIYMHVTGTMDDIFVLTHEMFHYMNRHRIIEVTENGEIGAKQQNFSRYFYTEAVSIIAEKLLGQYLLENGFINQNDYNLRMNNRFESVKKSALIVLTETNMFDLRHQGKDFNDDVVNNFTSYINEDEIISNDMKNTRVASMIAYNISKNGRFLFPSSQRYVVAMGLSDKFDYTPEKIEKFVEFNREVGNPEATFSNISKSI